MFQMNRLRPLACVVETLVCGVELADALFVASVRWLLQRFCAAWGDADSLQAEVTNLVFCASC